MSSEIVINSKNSEKHKVVKYQFKPLHFDEAFEEVSFVEHNFATPIEQEEVIEQVSVDANESVSQDDIEALMAGGFDDEVGEEEAPSAMMQDGKDEMIESLLKKAEEMGDKFLKVQMKLEQQDEEFKQKSEDIKNEAFQEGLESGKAQVMQEQESAHNELLTRLQNSITNLDGLSQNFDVSLQALQNELVSAALDIAKEVILKEVASHSGEIALALAKNLLEDIKESSQIILKVNPHDEAFLKHSLSTIQNVVIEADDAVNVGGVVLISDLGNIEGNIMKRYEKVKLEALK